MPNSLNRRKFLQTGALAGAAGFWSPSSHAQRIDIASSDIGKSKWDLDSPALCVDLDKMAQNIKALQTSLTGTSVGVRPHIKTHRCPEIAKMQVAMALRKKYKGFIQAIDNPQNAQDLQNAAKAAGIIADVVVDIDIIKRSGVIP